MTPQVLLVECADQPGLVHAVTGVLLRHGCNVIGNQEFVDGEAHRFFMRTEFTGDFRDGELENEIAALLPADARVRLAAQGKHRVLILASSEHHCLAELLVKHRFGEMNADLIGVLSNHERLRQIVEQFSVPFFLVPSEGRTREEHEAEVLRAVEPLRPEWLVLAKYMRILTPEFVRRFPRRIVNIHHSFLPAFVGAKPYQQAWTRGVKVIGATAHFVTDRLDEGPIIAQQVIPVDHTYDAADMARAGRAIEKVVLAHALDLILEDRVFLSGNRTIIFE